MSARIRVIALLSVSVLLLASCGGGDSSGRTRNSALCYETQEAKDAAVQAARDAFDAAMGGAPADETPEGTPTTIGEETPTTIEGDVPVITDDSSPELEEASGGGYRRPAVRTSSDGDTTTTVEASSEGGEVVLTVEQQQAQMDLEAAEAQPICETDAEGTSEVTCTATRTFEGVTDDCADGDVIVEDSNGGEWKLVNIAEDGSETILANGTYDVTTLGVDNPIIIPISYGGSGGGEEENSSDGCTATFTSTGVSWNCPNGELVNTSFDDNFDDNSWMVKSCSSEGFWNVADGQDFYFSVFLWSAGERFLDGLNTDFPLDTEIPFTVPEDTEGICAEETDQETEIDWDSLPFSGQSDLQVEGYSFTVPEGLEEPVYVRFESSSEFDVDIDDVVDFVDESACDGVCESHVGWSIWELAPGEYQFKMDENDQVVTWTSNVEIFSAPVGFPTLPFNYSTDGSKTTFSFVIEETQVVTLTATSGQTCIVSEDDQEENGFADPELDLYGPGIDEGDDNSGRGFGNCSAALLGEELEPGTYTVSVEDDDSEGLAVALGSSVELQLLSINWNLETIDVTNIESIEFNVPAGGAWFRAEVFTNQLETYTYSDSERDIEIDSGGCANPDGDYLTLDENCVYLNLVVRGGPEEEEYESGGDEYLEVTQVDGNWLESYINSYGRSMEVYFPEGTYTLVAWGTILNSEPMGEFTLKYGFASLSLTDAIEIDVKPIDNPEIPTNSSSAGVSTGAITSDGRISTAIASSVDELVCNTACINDLFAKAGITDGSITISAGNEVVKVKKGQRAVTIPLGSDADKISVTATSADGSQVVNLSSEIDLLSATEQSAFAAITASSPSDAGFNLLYLLLLIPILGAVVFVIRRKQTVSISQ